jgi:hypothetical protein
MHKLIFLLGSAVSLSLFGQTKEPVFFLTDTPNFSDYKVLYQGYKPFYLTAQQLPPPELIPTAAKTEKEQLALQLLSNKRTPLLEKLVQREDTQVAWIYLLYSEEKDPAYYPKTKLLIERSLADLGAYYLPYSLTYRRPVPYIVFPSLKSTLTTRFDYTFPCLQSAQITLAHLILQNLSGRALPQSSEFVRSSAERRLIYAFNYPSDIVEAQAMATRVFKQLSQSELFIKESANAKSEW